MSIKLGDKVKCKITGQEGIVTGLVQFITGCDQAIVQPPLDKAKAKPATFWLDIHAAEVVKAGAVKINNPEARTTGGPSPYQPK